jgi:pyrimidine deaminase RibD-like protein
MASVSEDEAMRRAVALAARGLGTTSPNPVVGCVILDTSGCVVGEGFHAYAGGPHAEIVALAQAGELARGGTAIVTLEPCDHTGRTGPCTRALINAGIRRVVVGVPDPNPLAGGGAHTLREAGVEVATGTLAIRQPLRVVVDTAGRTPLDAKVRDGAAPTFIATAADVGADSRGRVDLSALLATLHQRGVRAALLEGGPTLAGAFLATGLVDRVVGYVAPKLLGEGPAALSGAGVSTIAEAIELEYTDIAQVGPDLRFTAVPKMKG